MPVIRVNVQEGSHNKRLPIDVEVDTSDSVTTMPITKAKGSWHIPRPSLVGRSEKDSDHVSSWEHHHLHPNSSSRGSTSSQGSTASTHSAASGTLLLTAANLAKLTAMHPSNITKSKTVDNLSVASSTHFTVINGVGRPTAVYKKSWCARHQLTVLVCTMSFLFLMGLFAGILWMEIRARDKYN